MQITNIFFSLMLATAVVAKGGSKNGTSTKETKVKAVTDKSLCKEMAQLTQMVKLASNETKLAAKTKNNATKIADFQAKASEASTKLTTMESNTTLVSTCSVIAAAEDTKDACSKMKSLMKLESLAANETALTKMTKGNATKADAVKAKATEAKTKLADMMANTTLVDACSTLASSKEATKAGSAKAAASASGTAAAAAASTSASKSAGIILNANTGLISTILIVGAGIMML